MTTTAHEDQFTVGTQTIEKTVRQPYDTVAILRRNIADMEVALRTQTELKEKAEAENPLGCPYCKVSAPAPAVPAEWREAMQEAHDTFQRYADLHWAKDTRDSHEKAKVNQKLANKLYALLQSAEVRHD